MEVLMRVNGPLINGLSMMSKHLAVVVGVLCHEQCHETIWLPLRIQLPLALSFFNVIITCFDSPEPAPG